MRARGSLTERPAQTAHKAYARGSPAALLLTGHHAQTPAVLDHSRTLPQGDGRARPALAGGEEGGERNLIVQFCLSKPSLGARN